jgi:K+-transporting ATPase ATPase C chain
MQQQCVRAVRMLGVLTVLTGVFYPLMITVLAGVFFPSQSRGSLIAQNGQVVGSALVALRFVSERYFWPRPSAVAYQPLPSGASNLGPTNRVLRDSIDRRRIDFVAANPELGPGFVPAEMLTASGSGIDPHISPAAAQAQVGRVARARHLSDASRQQLLALAIRSAEPPQWGFLGMERVNVLLLNIALDSLAGTHHGEAVPDSLR